MKITITVEDHGMPNRQYIFLDTTHQRLDIKPPDAFRDKWIQLKVAPDADGSRHRGVELPQYTSGTFVSLTFVAQPTADKIVYQIKEVDAI